jgi:hypothetical protein
MSLYGCPIVVLFAAVIIHTAQKGAAYTAGHYVVPFGFGQIELAVTGHGHIVINPSYSIRHLLLSLHTWHQVRYQAHQAR